MGVCVCACGGGVSPLFDHISVGMNKGDEIWGT